MYVVKNIDGISIVDTEKLNEAVRVTIDFLLNSGIDIETIKSYKNTILLTEKELISKVNNSKIDSNRRNKALEMIRKRQKVSGIAHGDLRYTYLKDDLWVRDGLGIQDITDKFFNPMSEDNIIQFLDTTKKVDLSDIAKEDIYRAIEKYDELKTTNQLNKKRENRKYTLFVNSKAYLPKYLVSIAYGLKYNEETLNSEYSYATGNSKNSAEWCLNNIGFILFSDEKFKLCLKEKYPNQNTQNTYYNDLRKAITILQKIKSFEDKNILEIFSLVQDSKIDFEEYDIAQKSLGYDDKQLFDTCQTLIKEYLLCINNSVVSKNKIIQGKKSDMETGKNNLNQILFGPPGTGKTYNTINKALEILLEKQPNQNIQLILDKARTQSISIDERKQLKDMFDEFKNKDQVVFTTFHQSYGYEEFIEGIKPCGLDGDCVSSNSSEIRYVVQNGVFKELCTVAQNKTYELESISEITSSSKVWKISLGGSGSGHQVKKDCFDENLIRIGWESVSNIGDEEYKRLGSKVKNTLENFFEEMDIGDFVISLGSQKEADAIGIIEGEYERDDYKHYPHKRKVKWLTKNVAISIYELNGNKNLVQQTVYRLHRISPESLLTLADIGNVKTSYDNSQYNYVLIIDEINRGNISKIFGELITLIESSKRLNEEEELEVTLPYSFAPFGVPSNLYIIGTMNTADRSIALMDTALRRRFNFEEMMPEYEKTGLKSLVIGKNGKEINIGEMLQKINDRIEYLYDRDHQVGHTYFMSLNDKVKDENGRERNKTNDEKFLELRDIFRNKIIPLLQEYFYDDWKKIRLVLNDNGFIFEREIPSGLFKRNISDSFDDEKKVYKLDVEAFKDAANYQKIYN